MLVLISFLIITFLSFDFLSLILPFSLKTPHLDTEQSSIIPFLSYRFLQETYHHHQQQGLLISWEILTFSMFLLFSGSSSSSSSSLPLHHSKHYNHLLITSSQHSHSFIISVFVSSKLNCLSYNCKYYPYLYFSLFFFYFIFPISKIQILFTDSYFYCVSVFSCSTNSWFSAIKHIYKLLIYWC